MFFIDTIDGDEAKPAQEQPPRETAQLIHDSVALLNMAYGTLRVGCGCTATLTRDWVHVVEWEQTATIAKVQRHFNEHNT